MPTIQTGTIISIREDRKFGFLVPDGRDGEEIFFYANSTTTPFPFLRPGQRVTFEEVKSKKGPRALNVTLVQ